MKKGLIIVSVLFVFVFAFYKLMNREKDLELSKIDTSKIPKQVVNISENLSGKKKKIASGVEPHKAIKELNSIILAVKGHDQVSAQAKKLDERAKAIMKEIGKNHPAYPTLQIYSALANIIPSLEGILWEAGGVVVQSEFLYYGIIGALTDIAYANYMYSKPVDAFLEYLVRPTETSKRMKSASDIQDLLITKFIPLIEKVKLPEMESILKKYPSWNGFTFQYDRAIVSGGIDFTSEQTIHQSFASESDRYATFTRAYLASALGYAKNMLGFMYLFCAYDLETLPDFLNKAFYETIVATKINLSGKFKSWLNDRDSNLKLNTHKDYAEYLKDSSFDRLFTLYQGGAWSDGSVRSGQNYRTRALELFTEANDHDLEYVKQMEIQSKLPNQDLYIVDAVEMMASPRYSVGHYEKIAKVLRGPQLVMDFATGKSVKIDFPKLFSADFKKDLKKYFPISFDYEDRKDFYINMHGKQTFIYTYGRPNKWPDPKLNGFLPDATNSNLRELSRRLMYNNDIDYMASLVLTYIL